MKKATAIIAALGFLAACAPALSGCGGGVKFTLSEDGGKHYIVSYSGISRATGEYEIPAYYGEGEDYAPVTTIADEGFAGTNFSKITIPETVTEIGTAAFSYCVSLETVRFADGIKLETLSHGMFGKCASLQYIKIPDSVKKLDGLVFSGCTKLASVEMTAVETIGVRAFAGCTALEGITLPTSLTTIGTLAFYKSGLKSVEIPGSLRDTVKVDGEGNESTVYGLGFAAFDSCLNLESVKIENGVKVIPSGAFGNCAALKEIYIPLSVEEIQGAYSENGTVMYGHAFYYDEALTDVYFDGTEEQWKNIKIDYSLYSSSVNNEAIKNAVKHCKEV